MGVSYPAWDELESIEKRILTEFLSTFYSKRGTHILKNGAVWTVFAFKADGPREDLGDFLISFTPVQEDCLLRLQWETSMDGTTVYVYNSPDYWRHHGAGD